MSKIELFDEYNINSFSDTELFNKIESIVYMFYDKK